MDLSSCYVSWLVNINLRVSFFVIYIVAQVSVSRYTCVSVPICIAALDIKHLAYMPLGRVVLKIYMPCKNFYVPSQYLYKPRKAYVYCWENKYMPRLKNHLPSWAHNHKSLGALGQDLRAPRMRACLNVEPCIVASKHRCTTMHRWIATPLGVNPLRAKFFRGNINIYLHFVSFLHTNKTKVVEIPPRVREWPAYST